MASKDKVATKHNKAEPHEKKQEHRHLKRGGSSDINNPQIFKKIHPFESSPLDFFILGIPAEAFSPINSKEKLIFQSAMMQIFVGRQTFLREMLSHFTLLLDPYSDLDQVRLIFINEISELSNSTEATDFLLQQFAISSALLSRGLDTTSESVPTTEETSSSSSSSTAPTTSTITTNNRNTATSTNTTSNRDTNRELTSLVRSLQNEMRNMKISCFILTHSLITPFQHTNCTNNNTNTTHKTS
jgi:hypothetical protein